MSKSVKSYCAISFSLALLVTNLYGQYSLTELSPLPEKMTNGAIEFGKIGDDGFVYIWGSLDSTRNSAGIHQRGYRLNINENTWTALPNLPDTTGKVALSASRIGDIIFIVGGYHVLPNGNEVSSDKVHRFSIPENQFLQDAAKIPVAIDDQVQCVYKDSIIYVVTGWSNTGNVGDIQVYDPELNEWSEATEVPVVGGYRAFGASGCIIGDTIYYFGGASSSGINFPASNRLCKGYIHPDNPLEIDWFSSIPDPALRRYRASCIVAGNSPTWVGGSSVSYNYDGIAYNGSGAVTPVGNILSWIDEEFIETELSDLPMDIRAIARMTDSTWIIAGGMLDGPVLSDMVWMMTFSSPASINDQDYTTQVYPNPVEAALVVKSKEQIIKWSILDVQHKDLKSGEGEKKYEIMLNLLDLPQGVYWLRTHHPKGKISFSKFIKK